MPREREVVGLSDPLHSGCGTELAQPPRGAQHALVAYLNDQEVPLALTALVQTALRDYLAERGHLPPAHPLRITPAERGSGRRHVSVSHNRYLTQA